MEAKIIRAEEIILGLLMQAKQIGWIHMNETTIQRMIYLLQVLYSFKHNGENKFFDFNFIPTIYGPHSVEIDRAITDAESSERIEKLPEGGYSLCNAEYVTKDENILSWIRSLFLILGRYGERNIFGITLQDPEYQHTIQSNSTRVIDSNNPKNQTFYKLQEFKSYFEKEMGDVSAISDNEFLTLYFEFIFSQIIK